MARQRRSLEEQMVDLVTQARVGRGSILSTPAMAPVGKDMIEDNAILSEHISDGVIDFDKLAPEVDEHLTGLEDALTENRQAQQELGRDMDDLRDVRLPQLRRDLQEAQGLIDEVKNRVNPIDAELALLAQTKVEHSAAIKALKDVTLPALAADLEAAEGRLGANDERLTSLFEEVTVAVPAKVEAAKAAAIAAAQADAQAKATAAQTAAVKAADTAAKATAKAEAEAAESRAATTAAADAKAKADAAQAAALASAKTYADAQASGASGTALEAAKADATAKANAAKQAAISAAALDATAKKEAAEATAAADAKSKADKALADAKVDATTKADAALVAAKADAQTKADAAKQAAITAADTAAKATAKAAAEAAEARAAITAADDAKSKADAAQAAALAAAKTYAEQQASGASSTALEAAKADAQTKANAAKQAAIEAAALDATAKRELAESNAALDAKNKADKALADAKLDATKKADAAEKAAKDSAQAGIDLAVLKGQSLVLNGDFESGDTGWNLATGAQIISAAGRGHGLGLRVAPASGNMWPSNQWNFTSTGRTYHAEMWVRRAAGTTDRAGAAGFVYQSRIGGNGATSTPYIVAKTEAGTDVRALDIPTDSFIKLTAQVTINQEGATQARFAPWFAQSVNTYDVDNVLVVDVTETLASQAAAVAAAEETTIIKMNQVANSKNATFYGTAAPTATNPKGSLAGDTYRRRNSAGNIIGEWEWSGSAWTQRKMTSESMTAVDVGVLTAGTAIINEAVAKNIVAGTASFQTVDIGNITVTGDAKFKGIVAEKMAAQAAEFISLDIGTGTFGEMNGDRIKAETIVADRLLMGDFTNLLDDPLVKGPGWQIYSGTSAAPANITIGSATYTGWRINATNNSTAARIDNKNVFPVDTDKDTEFYVECTVSNRTNATFHFRVNWLGGTGASLGYTDRTFPARASGNTGWDTLTLNMKPPAGAAKAFLSLQSPSTATTGIVYLYNPVIRRKGAGKLIVDGSIYADQIDAQSVGAAVGTFVELNVENLRATKTAKLNDVVAETIGAGVGKFVELSTDQLKAGTAQMDTAVANKLFGDIITGRKFYGSQLYLGKPGNLYSAAPLDDKAWPTSDALITQSSTGGRNNAPSLTIAASSVQKGSYFGLNNADREKPPQIGPGGYEMTVYVKPTASVPIGGVGVYCRLYASSTGSTNQWASPSVIKNDKVLAANSWNKITGVFKVPEDYQGDGYCVLGLYSETANASASVTFSDLQLRAIVTPELIVDGTIGARHIAANSITVDRLKVSGNNAIPDPMFLDSDLNVERTNGSTIPNANMSFVADDESAAKVMKFTERSDEARTFRVGGYDEHIKVTQGDRIKLSFKYRVRGNATAGNSAVRWAMYHDTATKAYIRYVGLGSYQIINAAGTTWLTHEYDYVITQADTKYIRPVIQMKNFGFSGDMEIKEPRVEVASKLSVIAPVDSGGTTHEAALGIVPGGTMPGLTFMQSGPIGPPTGYEPATITAEGGTSLNLYSGKIGGNALGYQPSELTIGQTGIDLNAGLNSGLFKADARDIRLNAQGAIKVSQGNMPERILPMGVIWHWRSFTALNLVNSTFCTLTVPDVPALSTIKATVILRGAPNVNNQFLQISASMDGIAFGEGTHYSPQQWLGTTVTQTFFLRNTRTTAGVGVFRFSGNTAVPSTSTYSIAASTSTVPSSEVILEHVGGH